MSEPDGIKIVGTEAEALEVDDHRQWNTMVDVNLTTEQLLAIINGKRVVFGVNGDEYGVMLWSSFPSGFGFTFTLAAGGKHD